MKTATSIAALLGSLSSLAVAQLQCEIEVTKKEILPFEPVDIVCYVRNTNTVGVTAEFSRNLGVGIAKLHRKGTGWLWSDRWDFPLAGNPPARPWVATKEFAANESHACGVVPVFAWARGDEWRQVWGWPGQVPVRGYVGQLFSEPVTITIVEPKGLEAEACQAWTNLPLYYFYEECEVADHKLVKRICEFVDQYKGTIYADHALLRLGRLHIRGIADELDVERPVYRPDLATAEKYLQRAKESKHEEIAELAQYYMARCRLAQDDKPGASRIVADLLRQTKDPVVRFRAEKLRQEKLDKSR